jgi:hypothetical protein
MSVYCNESDVYAAVGSDSVPNPGRLCASVSDATDAFECDQHGLATDDPCAFRAEAGGALPAALAEGVTYYAIRLSASRFQVAIAPLGSAVNLMTDGDRVLVIREMPMAKWIDWASREVDQMLVGNAVELHDVNDVWLDANGATVRGPNTLVRAVTAKLAGYQARVWAQRDAGDLATLLDEARKMLARWAKGVPLRGPMASASANLALSGSAARTSYPRTYGSAVCRRDDEVIP